MNQLVQYYKEKLEAAENLIKLIMDCCMYVHCPNRGTDKCYCNCNVSVSIQEYFYIDTWK